MFAAREHVQLVPVADGVVRTTGLALSAAHRSALRALRPAPTRVLVRAPSEPAVGDEYHRCALLRFDSSVTEIHQLQFNLIVTHKAPHSNGGVRRLACRLRSASMMMPAPIKMDIPVATAPMNANMMKMIGSITLPSQFALPYDV